MEFASYLPDFGYACDVGANDGTFNSVTLEYEHKGWMVLCVEPNPLLEIMGRGSRKLWRQVAAGERDEEERQFWAVGGGTFASHSRIDYGTGEMFPVKARTLDRLIEEAGFPRLDLLAVDAEGWEEFVMKGFSQHRWKPKIILLEHWGHGFANVDPNNPLPVDGYEKIGMAGVEGFDVVYLRKEGS